MKTSIHIGQLCLRQGFISLNELAWALQRQALFNRTYHRHLKLGQILIFSKLLTPKQLELLLQLQRGSDPQDRAELEVFKLRSSVVRDAAKASGKETPDGRQSFWKRLKRTLLKP